METLRFKALIERAGINPYVGVSAARAAKLKPGWRKPMPVRIRINGKPEEPWRINMMPMGDGGFYLYLHAAVRKASGTGVGDKVDVEASFDPDYRNGPMHPMPAWFRGALRGNPAAAAAWKRLRPSLKKEILRHFSRLKSPEARERNLALAMGVLSGRPGRFLARSWKDGGT